MNDFSILINKLDRSTDSKEKVAILSAYFVDSNDHEKITTLAVLIGKTPDKTISIQLLKEWAIELAQIPHWLFDDSYNTIGDLTETIATIIDQPKQFHVIGVSSLINEIQNLINLPSDILKEKIHELWLRFTIEQRFVFNKLLTATFKSPVSKRIIYKAISNNSQLEYKTIAIRLSIDWNLNSTTWSQLIFTESQAENHSFSFPFMIPISTDSEIETEIIDHIIEWNYNGIRAQIIKRNNQVFLWSKKSELITDLFPEILKSAAELPEGTVLDGIIIPMSNGKIQPKSILKSRLARKKLSPKLLKNSPVQFIAFDILEWKNQDQRNKQLSDRKSLLQACFTSHNQSSLLLSDYFHVSSKSKLIEKANLSRQIGANGIVLKSLISTYNSTKSSCQWLKIAPTPFSVNAVIIYASSSETASNFQFSEFTFALWDAEILVPIAKASIGFTDEQLDVLNGFIKKNTIEKFGPVRSILPHYVFKLKFDDIQSSTRHKAGFQLINPEVLQIQELLSVNEIDSIQILKNLIRE